MTSNETTPRPGVRAADGTLFPATLSLFLLALCALPARAAYPNGYSYCKVVTTQHSMVSGTNDLVNYPLTVALTDPDLRTVVNGGLVNNSSGYDIAFYPDCSGSGAALKWELESYSPTSGAIVAHVLRPILSHTTDDSIGIFYGGAFSTFQSTPSAVWDAWYKGVWHLANGVALTATDSTGNANHGTLINGPSAAAGQIDGAASFASAASQYVSVPDAASLDTTSSGFTVSAWINAASFSGTTDIVVKNSSNNRQVNLAMTGAQSFINCTVGAGNYKSAIDPASLSTGAWHYLVGTYDGATLIIYTDGVSRKTLATGGACDSTSGMLAIGREGSVAIEYFNGVIDEVRLSGGIARSADWILTEYRNQSAPATYMSVGLRLTPGVRVRHRAIGGA
jgi:hypothetical protein